METQRRCLPFRYRSTVVAASGGTWCHVYTFDNELITRCLGASTLGGVAYYRFEMKKFVEKKGDVKIFEKLETP